MDEIESSDFFPDPDSPGSTPKSSIEPDEEPTIEIEESGIEEAEPALEISLDDTIGAGPEIEIKLNMDENSEPELELDLDVDMGSEPEVEIFAEENLEPQTTVSTDLSTEPEVELELDADPGPEEGITPKADLDAEVETELDLVPEPSAELEVEISPGPEPAVDLEPETELAFDDIDKSEATEASAPPPSEEIAPEPDEESSDPFFSAYIKMADSLKDDDEDLDSLVEELTSSEGDDDLTFINETPGKSIDHEDKLHEEADRAQSRKSLPEETAVGNTGDKKTGAFDSENLREVVKSVLGDSIKKELSGMSESVKQTVQDVVKEVTPDIVRNIIQEEIEKIKKLEDN